MGVGGLWKEIEKAYSTTTWAQLSEAHFGIPNGSRGFKVGVDMSLWLYHAEIMKQPRMDEHGEMIHPGVNADFRTIFFKLCLFLQKGILAVLVFDGPQKPDWKRGRRVGGGTRIDPDYKKMIELMGMEWRIAAGEAEAELAAMNERGEIDAVLSDDVDNFLFGAKLVIRNPSKGLSANQSKVAMKRKESYQDQQLPTSSFCSPTKPTSSFPSASSTSTASTSSQFDTVPPAFDRGLITFSYDDILSTTGLCREDMILVALMSGGDYSEGIKGCGPIISRRLAEAGYGRKLLNGIKRLAKEETEVQKEFLQSWREEVAEVLKTDPDKILDRKSPSLAKKLLELYDFPDRNIVKNYAHPKISRVGTQKPLKWSQDIDIGGLVRYASDKFEWGNEELVATFRNNLWAGVLLRQLRRSALAQDQGSRLASSGALVESVHDFKNEGSTDFTPSYRLHLNSTAFDDLIDPHLPHPDPFPIPDYDFYTQEDADLLRAERKSEGRKVKKPPVPGTSDFRHWIPAAFISVDKDLRNKVRDWKEGKDKKEREKEDKEEKKAERARAKAEGRKSPVKRTSTKSKKNAGGAGKKSAEDEEEEDEEDMLEVTAKLRKEKFAEQRKKEKEQERAAKAAAEKGAKIKGKGKAKEEVLTKSTKSARPPPSPSSSSDIEILPNPSTSRLRANKSASPSTSNLLNSFAPTKSSLPNRTTRKSPPASSTLLFNASKSTVTLPPKRPNRPAPSSDSESDSPQTFSTSSKHVDKSKRRSKAHTSPSKPKLQSSLIELSSSTSSDSDLDSLETILTTKEKARLSQEGRRTDSNGSMKKLGASSSQSSLAASSSSLASSSSKGKGNAKEKKKEKAHEVEVMVLSD